MDRIGDYARGGYHLRVFCMTCGHVILLNPIDVQMRCRTHAQRFIDDIERRMKCRQCGARNAAYSPVER